LSLQAQFLAALFVQVPALFVQMASSAQLGPEVLDRITGTIEAIANHPAVGLGRAMVRSISELGMAL
jgi:hypothetical protein